MISAEGLAFNHKFFNSVRKEYYFNVNGNFIFAESGSSSLLIIKA